MNTLFLTDGYKLDHHKMYPEGTELVYSNLTPRSNKFLPECDKVIVAGIQYILQYVHNEFQTNFFNKDKEEVLKELQEEFSMYQGKTYDVNHFGALHDLGYLPICVKAIDEGEQIPIKVPVLTIVNTHKDFFWLTNYLETLLSNLLWLPMTSASTAYAYKKILTRYARNTDQENIGFVNFQAHDFSMRGMGGLDATILSGIGHAFVFEGSDNLPIIPMLRKHYNAEGFIVGGVPATEHSVMCAGGKETEIETYRRLLELYPTGILSLVSDTWDLWKVCTEYLPQLKDKVLARNGKLVIRPDSGDPVDIICGTEKSIIYNDNIDVTQRVNWTTVDLGNGFPAKWLICKGKVYEISTNNNSVSDVKFIETNFKPEQKGVVELLWDVFGGTENEQGYKVLDPHIGVIYGDSVTLERCEQICQRLESKGFASTNIVFGIGSYTYQYKTRDSFGFAVKATYIEVNGEGQEIFKDPITDGGTKKSAKGLLLVTKDEKGDYILLDQRTKAEEAQGELKVVYQNGNFTNLQTLKSIRKKLK